MKRPYYIASKFTESPDNSHKYFQLHSHEFYEIYFFIEGDAKCIIEGKSYTLEPYDIMIINKNEFHQIFHNSVTPYRRITLQLRPDFFALFQCEEYENALMHASVNTGNKISGKIVRSSGIYDVFMRFGKYTNNYELEKRYGLPVAYALIVEILHLINQVSLQTTSEFLNPSIQPVLTYLNQHFIEDITLDFLQEKFFLSKYHLCRTFRVSTGLTLHEYLRKKRLANVRELKNQGMTITEAAIASGFKDYSSFYRAYQKEYGISPRKDLE